MYVLATACRCAESRILERGWCHACGRLLEVELGYAVGLDGWLRLDLTVLKIQLDMRTEAARLGITEDADYAAWLEEIVMSDDKIPSVA